MVTLCVNRQLLVIITCGCFVNKMAKRNCYFELNKWWNFGINSIVKTMVDIISCSNWDYFSEVNTISEDDSPREMS